MTIAIILFADDAALPADSVEDLAISLSIFEEFCRESRLTIAVNKSFVIVFHDSGDAGVTYDNCKVFVDGSEVVLKVYGEQLPAVSEFKYLGVYFDASGTQTAHVKARAEATRKAGFSLIHGLQRMPGFSHACATDTPARPKPSKDK